MTVSAVPCAGFAGAGQRKASGLLAGVDHVIARRGGERHAGIRCRNGYGNTARRGRFTAVDLYDRRYVPRPPGRECYRPVPSFATMVLAMVLPLPSLT